MERYRSVCSIGAREETGKVQQQHFWVTGDISRHISRSKNMGRFFDIRVDTEELTNEAYAFVIEPTPKRNERPFIQELHDIYPEMVDVLECMVIDGTEERQDVADYVETVFAQGAPFRAS
jgi:hypothetical protein